MYGECLNVISVMIIAVHSLILAAVVLVDDHPAEIHQTVTAHLGGRAHAVEAAGFVYRAVGVVNEMAVVSVPVVVFNG